jgi:hypothetical protein
VNSAPIILTFRPSFPQGSTTGSSANNEVCRASGGMARRRAGRGRQRGRTEHSIKHNTQDTNSATYLHRSASLRAAERARSPKKKKTTRLTHKTSSSGGDARCRAGRGRQSECRAFTQTQRSRHKLSHWPALSGGKGSVVKAEAEHYSNFKKMCSCLVSRMER